METRTFISTLLAIAVSMTTVTMTWACCAFHFHFNGRLRRSLANMQETEMLFKLCDTDNSSDVTVTELSRCFSQAADNEVVPQEFINKLDRDGDDKLDLAEFGPIQIDVADAVGCYERMLIVCGTMFLTYSRTRGADDNLVCGALEEYSKCVASEAETCDTPEMNSFKHSLVKIMSSGQQDGIDCPDIDPLVVGNTSVYIDLACTKGAIVGCDERLIQDVSLGKAPCQALASYNLCLDLSADECEDDVIDDAISGTRSLISTYMKNRVCD